MLIRNHVAIVVVGVGIAVGSAYAIGTSDEVVGRILAGQTMQRVRAPCAFRRASFTFLAGVEIRGLVVLDPESPFGPPLLAAESAKGDYTLDAFGDGPRILNVDVSRPRLKIERRADGSLPIKDVFYLGGEGPSLRPFVVKLRSGTAEYVDAEILSGEPLSLTDVNIDVTPADPTSADWEHAAVSLKANSDVLGPIKASAIVGKAQESVLVAIEIAETRFDVSLPRRFAGDFAKHAADMAPAGEASARISARVEKGRELEATVDVDLRDASVRVTLPGDPAPKPFDVTQISGRLRYASDRLETKDLVLHALGAEIRVDASIDAVSSAAPRIEVNAKVAGLVLDDALRERLPRTYRRIADAYDLRGTADATVSVRGDLASPAVDVAATFARGHVRYDGFLDEKDGKRYGFAYDVEDVQGKVSVEGSTVRIEASGRHGPATVRAAGTVVMAGAGHDVPDINVVAENVPLDESVRKAFNDGGAKSFDPWKPSGTAAKITVQVRHDPAGPTNHDAVDVTLDLDGRAQFRPHVFPAALSDVRGRVEVLETIADGLPEDLVRLTDVAGKGDGFDVRVSGEVRGAEPTNRDDLRIHADVADCTGAFRRAVEAEGSKIPPGAVAAVRKLGPSGALGIDAHVVRAVDGKRRDVVDFDLKGAAVTGYDDVPLAARGLTGSVHLEGDDLTFADIAGEFVMGDFAPRFRASGRLAAISDVPQPTIHVEASEVPLGESIRGVLGPLATKAENFWNIVAPVGSVRADCVLDLRPDADPTPFEILLTGIHGGLAPLGLELDCDGGTFHFDGRRAEIRGLDAAIGAATVRFDSVDYDKESGEVDIRASELRALRFPEDLEGPLSKETIERIVASAPGRTMHAPNLHLAYRPSPTTLAIDGDVLLRPRTRHPMQDEGYAPDGALAIERLVFLTTDDGPVTFEGAAHATDFAFRAGLAVDKFDGPLTFSGDFGESPRFTAHTTGASFRVEEFPFQKADVDVVPARFGERVEVARAKFMSGDFSGKVGPGENGVGYQGFFKLNNADLERLLRSRGSSGDDVATGVLDADLQFRNPTGVRADLRGDGKIAVSRGDLMRAPGLSAAAIKVATLGLITADLTDGEMKFDLEGDRLLVTKLEVKSSGVNALANGKGWIELGGRLDVSLDTISFPIPIIRQILGLLQMRLLRTRVTGTIRNPRTTTEWISLGGGGDSLRAEPPPAGDVRPPDRDPW
jgi:hypothetical protein